MSEIHFGQRATSPDPIELNHVATKGYVDSEVQLAEDEVVAYVDGMDLDNLNNVVVTNPVGGDVLVSDGAGGWINSSYLTTVGNDVDGLIQDMNLVQDYVEEGIESDRAVYGDRYSPFRRREAIGIEPLATGSLTFSGGLVPATPWTTSVVPRVRFYVRAAAPAGAVITFAVYQGTSRTALSKVGTDVVATPQFASTGFKNVMLGTSVQLRDELPYVYLAVLRTGGGTPDPSMAALDGPALADLINPAPTQMISGVKTGQAALPATLDTSAAFTATGRPIWFALSF